MEEVEVVTDEAGGDETEAVVAVEVLDLVSECSNE